MCNQKYLLCFVILILTACGINLPEWVTKPPANENLVYAVASTKLGKTETKETAIERASEKAKDKLLQSLTIAQSNSPYKSNAFYRIFRWKLETIQPPPIKGFKIEKTYVYRESPQKEVYVLLSLNRQIAIKAIRADMSKIDTELKKYESVSESLEKLTQFKQLVPALPLIEKRRHLEHQLLMLSNKGEVDLNNALAIAIENRIYTLGDNLKILLKPLNKKAIDIEPYLIQEITMLGLKVFDAEKHPDVIIEFGLKTRLLKKDNIEFVFATGDIKIRDNRGRILKGFVKDVKGASSIPGGAYERAAKNLSAALVEELVDLTLNLLGT